MVCGFTVKGMAFRVWGLGFRVYIGFAGLCMLPVVQLSGRTFDCGCRSVQLGEAKRCSMG